MRGLEAITAVALPALTGCSRFAPKDNWARLAGRAPGRARERLGGTGFLLPGGSILIAKHVVAECKVIRATARSGTFEAASARLTAIPSKPADGSCGAATR
jgi:hypothetical protein